jgi:hypothetical protein
MKLARILFVALANLAVLGAFAGSARADYYSFEGDGGFQKSFPLIGGEYDLYVVAKYPFRGYNSPGSRYCYFGGMLERTSPTYDSRSLGTNISLSSDDVTPWKIDHVVTLPAGQYKLYITRGTDCKWSFLLTLNKAQTASQSGVNENGSTASTRPPSHIMPVEMQRQILGLYFDHFHIDYASVPVSEPVRFESMILAARGTSLFFGTYKIKHGESVVKQGDLMGGPNDNNTADIYYIDVQWDRSSTKYLGKNTIEFVTAQGTNYGEFTLTK